MKMEEFDKNLKEAIRHLHIADHMLYVTFPLVKENRLLLKIFDEIYASIIRSINSVLKYERFCKRINSYNYNNNFDTFIRIAKNYGLSDEHLKKIKEVIIINKRHKQSSMEFIKKDKIVIMSNKLGIEVLDLSTIKQYLLVAKELLVKVSHGIR